MGNRAIITTPERRIGLYLHWSGGRDTVEPLLRYCELKGYRDPAVDDYGWARMAQMVGNFFGGADSVGIMPYSDDASMNPGDNGIYVVEGWKIVERVGLYEGFEEQGAYGFDEMLRDFDHSMPEGDRLGELLDSVEVPVDELEISDEVWMFTVGDIWKAYPVVGFGQPEFNKISVWVKTPDGQKTAEEDRLPREAPTACSVAWDAELLCSHINCYRSLHGLYEWHVLEGGYDDVDGMVKKLVALKDGLAEITREAEAPAESAHRLSIDSRRRNAE